MGWQHTLALAADIASVMGLMVSAVVWLNVRKLRAFYTFRARVPEVIASLNERASNLSSLLSDFEGSRQSIELELAEAAVLIRSLAKKSSGAPRAAAESLASRIELNFPRSASDARQLYVAIRTLLLTFKEVQSDYNWEP